MFTGMQGKMDAIWVFHAPKQRPAPRHHMIDAIGAVQGHAPLRLRYVSSESDSEAAINIPCEVNASQHAYRATVN